MNWLERSVDGDTVHKFDGGIGLTVADSYHEGNSGCAKFIEILPNADDTGIASSFDIRAVKTGQHEIVGDCNPELFGNFIDHFKRVVVHAADRGRFFLKGQIPHKFIFDIFVKELSLLGRGRRQLFFM